jgi:hypothetical protein
LQNIYKFEEKCGFFRERGSGEESPGADHSSNNTPETGQFKPVITAPTTPLKQVSSNPSPDQNQHPLISAPTTPWDK